MESFFAVTKSLIIRALVIYFISQLLRRPSTTDPTASQPGKIDQKQLPAFNYFENGTLFDLHMYLTEKSSVQWDDGNELIWFEEGLIYGDWYAGVNRDGIYSKTIKFKPSQQLQRNGSIYLYAYLTKTGTSPNPNAGENYAGKNIAFAMKMLNKFKKISYKKTVNLLTGDTEQSVENQIKADTMKSEIVSHWHPNITVNVVFDQTAWTKGSVPPPLDEFIHFMPGK